MRLFVAIDIEPAVLASLAEMRRQLEPCGRDLRWVRPEAIHLTLKFLGEVARPRLGGIEERLEMVRGAAFKVSVSGVGFFPTVRAPRVFWVGVRSKDLARLVDTIEKQITELDFPAERRKFNPHLTLARTRRDGRMNRNFVQAAERFRDRVFGEFTADRFCLYQSQLDPAGAIYKKLHEYTLE